MKQVNFSHPGGFPLEQETLERLQTAYRSELFEAIKSHLSIVPDTNYILSNAESNKQGWAIIHQNGEGILYPISKGSNTGYLKTTRTGTNLVYGTGASQTAYFDFEAKYITQAEFTNKPANPQHDEALSIYYYDLSTFKTVKSILAIEEALQSINTKISAAQQDISVINQSYLPLNGSKAMLGDLDLGSYKLSKLDTKETSVANLRTIDFRLGSASKRGLLHPSDPLGRALVDNSDQTKTNLTLNYNADWDNTYIGGKVYLNNLNTTSSNGTLLVLDSQNQINKNNTLIDSLINRITVLENKPTPSSIPIGMIAIWGKPAPFPEGWEEYVPLKGRMPIGLDTNDLAFSSLLNYGGNKQKTLTINEIPPHTHSYEKAIAGRGYQTKVDDNPLGTNISETSGETGGGLPFSIMNPYRVVHFIEYTGKASDTTKPTNPTNLTASNIGTTTLTLNWTAATDNVGVTNYLVYKNGNLLAELGNVLSYNVTELSKGTTYIFSVTARDAAGNLSDPATVNATTISADLIAPTVPSYFHCVHNGQGNIGLQWATSIDDDGPITYELSRKIASGPFTVFKTTTDTYHYEIGSPNTTYSYRVRAIDPSGNASDYKEASITLPSF